MKQAIRREAYISFIIFDIDHFKGYNDAYGHRQGDDVIKNVAESMKAVFRRGEDYLFRLGGEEFGVLTLVENEGDALILGENLRKKILSLKIPHSTNSSQEIVSISGGVITHKGEDLIPFDTLYQLADEKLYDAKNSGRNRVFAGAM